MSSPDPALKRLDTLVSSVDALIKTLLLAIRSNSSSSSSSSPESTVNPILLARDSAALIKSHTTKLSLLIINEPFTPSAISSVLSDLTAALLSLASSVQSCDPTHYTHFFRRELASRCERILLALSEVLRRIPRDGKALVGRTKDSSIPSTGLVWAACDNLTALANMDVAGFYVHKTSEWKDTLEDILSELKEWGEEQHEDDSPDDDSEPDNDQDLLDALVNSSSIPPDDPDRIRPRLAACLKSLRLVILFYQATVKRRLTKLPPFPPADLESTTPRRLDEIASLLGQVPDRFGDLACAFYELLPPDIDDAMLLCFDDASAASTLVDKSWNGSQDDFTKWTERFRLEISKAKT